MKRSLFFLLLPLLTFAQVRINSGGSQAGQWAADAHFSTSNTFSTAAPIAGTDNDAIYQSERWGSSFGYAIPLANGNYTVNLHFAEIFLDLPRQRVFNMNVEGQALNNFDILALTAKNTALVRSFGVILTDGILNINFTSIVNHAKISGIEIIPIPVTLPERTDTTRRGDTVRIAYYYPTVDTFTQITEIYMPSFYGGRVLVNDSTTLYKALFGVLPPLRTDTEITPRVYRFNYSGFRLTLFRTGAWIRQRLINGQWVDVPY